MLLTIAELIFSGPQEFQESLPASIYTLNDSTDYYLFREKNYEIFMNSEISQNSIELFTKIFSQPLLPIFSTNNFQIFRNISFSIFVTSKSLFKQSETNLMRQAVEYYQTHQNILLSVSFLEDNLEYFEAFGCKHIPCVVVPQKKFAENVVNFAQFLEKQEAQWDKIEPKKEEPKETISQPTTDSFSEFEKFSKTIKNQRSFIEILIKLEDKFNVKYMFTAVIILVGTNFLLLRMLKNQQIE